MRDLPLTLDPRSALARASGIAGLPATFPIDADGQVVRALSGPAEWDPRAAVGLIRYYLKQGCGKSRVRDAGVGR